MRIDRHERRLTNPVPKLIYAYDPLCGWCYGLIPALRNFSAKEPGISVEVLPGGLFTGTPARPYATLVEHIRSAEQHLFAVTGRKPSALFRQLIAESAGLKAASEPPSYAVLQMNELTPERALDFAHALQEVHYEKGADLNAAQTYDDLCTAMGLPLLDTDAIFGASLDDPKISAAYARCMTLRPSGFPTIFVVTKQDQIAGRIPSTYDPDEFLAQFRAIRDALGRQPLFKRVSLGQFVLLFNDRIEHIDLLFRAEVFIGADHVQQRAYAFASAFTQSTDNDGFDQRIRTTQRKKAVNQSSRAVLIGKTMVQSLINIPNAHCRRPLFTCSMHYSCTMP